MEFEVIREATNSYVRGNLTTTDPMRVQHLQRQLRVRGRNNYRLLVNGVEVLRWTEAL